jgi:hypothetical protein
VASELNNHHRDTLEKILGHPASGNVEWRQVVSLIEAVGTVAEEPGGKLKVTIGPETEVLTPPHDKDVDKQTIVDLRRMLVGAGFGPGSGQAQPDERDRDFGDSRRGEPG